MPLYNPTAPIVRASWPSSTYMVADNILTKSDSAPSIVALETFLPFVIPSATNLVRIGIWLVTPQVGAECRLGLYQSNPATGVPSILVADAGTLDLSTGSGVAKEATVNWQVPPGVYWSCCQLKNVATQVSLSRVLSADGKHLLYPSAAGAVGGSNGGGSNRYYSRSITYGSALLAAAAVVTASNGTDCPVTFLRSA
jgi:hypothetical protein